MNNDNIVKLAALHRHWIIADSVRVVLQQKTVTPEQEERAIKQFGVEYVAFGEHASMVCRMQVWYSLLYVVVKGYRELGQEYQPLEEVLAKAEYVDLLRRFRNATFHFQADPLNDKLIDFLDKQDSEIWIRDLNKQLEAFFMQALPLKETAEKLEHEGAPKIPPGTKLSTLFQWDKK
ncbi:hypothetical protein B7L17_002075 [Burkholderia cenocepacia]|uniref:hypothetical protein n=1 Tax=Burkholderia cenocepacia TaxID=95486 RepID=UPI00223755A1|nr:hypothetical protein [Burkholderia cenocepacia]MCW5115587.1 hypothetical protein [Burkholderia cenocepacia]MCW5129041.1 hypothetical protein [Burkholderia cenocepacia]MCW5172035.1 hypothetical protein [Burkholderia cenocepacia]